MLSVPDDVAAMLRTHQKGAVYGIAGGVRLGLEQAGSLSFNAGVAVEASGGIHVVGVGNSLVPRSKTDLLAPYGQEVALYRDILGPQDQVLWTLPLGVFRIVRNSGARETVRRLGPSTSVDAPEAFFEVAPGLYAVNLSMVENPVGSGMYDIGDLVEDPPGSGLYIFDTAAATSVSVRNIVLDWEVDVELDDRFRMLERAKLIEPSSPVPGNSMYDELRRLSLMPVQESLTDVAVPAGMVYEDRLKTVRALAELADGVPCLTRQGVLTLRPKSAMDYDPTPVFDIEATITWAEEQTDEFYNYVWAHSDNKEFNGFASITDDANPLSVNRAGPSTYEHSSPLYTTDQAAQDGAATVLRRLQRRSKTVTVECLPDALLIDLGDVGWVRDPVQGRSVLGEVVGIQVPLDPTAPVGLDLLVPEGV